MDKFDTAILSTLQQDGRTSWLQLAKQVNLSASAVQRRVESLQERGVIENFTVNFNEEALPIPLFARLHDVSPDGQRFLVSVPEADGPNVLVSVNWAAGSRSGVKRVP